MLAKVKHSGWVEKAYLLIRRSDLVDAARHVSYAVGELWEGRHQPSLRSCTGWRIFSGRSCASKPSTVL